MRHFVRLALGTLLFMAAAGAAMAIETCTGGEFSASPLRALPAQAAVGVDLTDNSAENAGLANAFTRGMSDAGAPVAGSRTATVKLRLSWQVLGSGGGGGNQTNEGSAPQPFVQGGIDRAPPPIATNDLLRGRSGPLPPGLLVFRAEARDPTGATVYWIGSIQCTLRGGEDDRLLYQLGQVIGGAIGQRRDHVGM